MKITIRWFDGMKRTYDVVDKQICSDNTCLTFENGDEMWIPNKGVRYVRIPAQNTESEISQTRRFGKPIAYCARASEEREKCLAEHVKAALIRRKECGKEKSTMSEIRNTLIATGSTPDTDALRQTLNIMARDNAIHTYIGVGVSNAEEAKKSLDILYALPE